MKWCWRLWKHRRPSHRSSSKCVVGMRELGMSFGAMSFRMLLAASNRILNTKMLKRARAVAYLCPELGSFRSGIAQRCHQSVFCSSWPTPQSWQSFLYGDTQDATASHRTRASVNFSAL